MSTMLQQHDHDALTIDAPACGDCGDCGEVLPPAGGCLNVGDCRAADASATRGASRQTAKFAVPAAWNASGRVD
jgi:hypothetical protein